MSDNGELLTCLTCCASFRRAEHLRRHLASHSPSRPFKCNFCGACFKRRDVLRKHLKGCSERIDRDLAMPGRLLVGKKATSCDQCARSKKACDSKAPCSMCEKRRNNCTYERRFPSNRPVQDVSSSIDEPDFVSDFNYDFADDTSMSGPGSFNSPTSVEWPLDWDDSFVSQQTETPPDQNQTPPQNTQTILGVSQLPLAELPAHFQESCQRSFDFLLNFTRGSGLRTVFNYKRQRQLRCAKCDVFPESTDAHEADSNSAKTGRREISTRLAACNMEPPFQDQQYNRVSLVSLAEYLDDPLFAQTKAIWDSFRMSTMRSLRNLLLSTEDAELADEGCLQFFCPSNLRKFIQIFWDEWYPHCPIIHRPTFDILRTPAILLVPMVIMGACMSPNPQEVSRAKEWLEFGEELVFSSPLLSGGTDNTDIFDTDTPPFRIIQAAYITCLLLNWEGSDIMKRRVRHHRFAAVVSAVREIGLSRANHFPRDHVNADNFEWQMFIQREEAIRTFTYVFLLDTSFVIFNNAPPRMVLHEMNLEMTVPEACFQAKNAADCYTQWHSYVTKQSISPTSTPLLLAEAISTLVQDNYHDRSLRFMNLSTLNLFTLVGGLHTVVFQQRSLLICLPMTLLPIRNALARWQSAWEMRTDKIDEATPRESWQDTGFIGQAQEFAWLVLARLDTLESPTQEMPNAISGYAPIAQPASGLLDDTSMSLVTDLMLRLTMAGR